MSDSSPCADACPSLGLSEHTFTTTPSFHEFYWRLKSFVDRTARKYQRDRIDADDLKQVGYIAIWKAHKAFRPETGVPIEHYARRAVVNEMLKESLRGYQQQELLHVHCPLDSDDGEWGDAAAIEHLHNRECHEPDPVFQSCATREVNTAAREAAVHLTKSQRQVFNLLFIEGLTVQEAACQLGVSHQNVSKQQRKVIDTYRKVMGVAIH